VPQLAQNIEDIYLTRYFGENLRIKIFAKKLLRHKNLYQHADALRELNKTISTLGSEAPADAIIKKLQEKYDLQWTNLGDIPFPLGKEGDPNAKLPSTPEAWKTIRKLAPLYGWRHQSAFLGEKFVHINSNDQIRCFHPEEARVQMGIPFDVAIAKLIEQ
jgi:hypothetical protein